ncbi:response regulator receiver domain-containing protein [Roseinatronobacter monicus]|uniref:Response regulator receiver domain-containing protein n=2 Tax=Roseinatronobacter monicus TaxID=393481 RepID=A0A543KA74_9RHOB|nr:response regulator receiver domain-containing protein [Roseinatronobacter monicus]
MGTLLEFSTKKVGIMHGVEPTSDMVSALICAQDGFYRTALESILKDRLYFQHIASVETLDQAVDHIAGADGRVNLALFDLDTRGLNNRNAIQALREGFPSMLVVLIASSQSRQAMVGALEAGAHGFLNRDLGVSGFVEALHQIARGQIYVPPYLAYPDT